MAAKGGDSKNGLIISLVISILLVIGLGVSTYFGYAEQEDLRKKEKDAKTAEATMRKTRDWYQFLAWQYKSYLGRASKNDATELTPLRGQFDTGQLGKSEKNFAENEATIKKLDDRNELGWVGGENRPLATAFDRIATLDNELRETRKKLDAALADAKQAQDDKRRAEDVAAQAAADYKKSLQALQQQYVAFAGQRQKAFEDMRAQAESENRRFEEAERKAALVTEEMQKKLKTVQDERGEFENLFSRRTREKQELEDENKRLRGQIDPVNPLESGPPRGKIIRLDRSATTAWINLGSADNLRPQVRFSIFKDKGNGTATGELKGSLQVTEIVGERIAKVQITYTQDPNRNPISPGDLIYNPGWSATAREHVAIAGLIDLTGLGTDNTQEFIRNLERQGVSVDAYLDLKDLTEKGKGMTLQTSYLILGDSIETNTQGLAAENNRQEAVRAIGEKVKGMIDRAQKLGVPTISYRRYLVLSGHRIPRNAAEAAPLAVPRPAAERRGSDVPRDLDAPKKEPAKAAPAKEDGKDPGK